MTTWNIAGTGKSRAGADSKDDACFHIRVFTVYLANFIDLFSEALTMKFVERNKSDKNKIRDSCEQISIRDLDIIDIYCNGKYKNNN